MTADEYRAQVRGMGLTPARRAYEGSTVHQDRNGEFWTVPDPDGLSAEEREAVLGLLKLKLDVE